MDATVLIPARYASTRLPGKPLLDATGKPLIRHVVEAAGRARCAGRVVVATDDERIRSAVEGFGGEAVMTSPDCRTGTDRLAEACEALGLADDHVVLNVQGDEPDIPPAALDELARLIHETDAPMATLAAPLSDDRAADPSKVKVVVNAAGGAMYFSRARIPFDRDGAGHGRYLLHLGVYAYRVAFLRWFARAPATPCETAEKLEQLRALEHGHAIAVGVVDYHGVGIDTPEDYDAFVRRVRTDAKNP